MKNSQLSEDKASLVQGKFLVSYLRITLFETILFLLVFAMVLYGKVVDGIKSREETLSASMDSNVRSINMWSKEQFDSLSFLSESAAFKQFLIDPNNLDNQQRANSILEQIHGLYPSYYTVGLVRYQEGSDPYIFHYKNSRYRIDSGDIILDSVDWGKSIGTSVLHTDYIKHIFGEGYDYYFSEAKANAVVDRPACFVAAKRIEEDGKLLGALFYVIDLQFFSETFGNIFLGRTGETFIVDERGLFISYPTASRRILTPITKNDSLPKLSEVKNTDQLRSFYDRTGKHFFFFSRELEEPTPTTHSLYLVFRQESSEILGPIIQSIIIDATVGLFIILFSSILLRWATVRFTKTIQQEKRKTQYANERLLEINITDNLTGLYNRHYFEQMAHSIGASEGPNSLILCDLDGLKLINDAFGHVEGDLLINRAKTVLKGCLPKTKIARIGGDEFAILLPGYSHTSASILFKRLQAAIATYNEQNRAQILPLSISMGLSSRVGKNQFQTMLKEADETLYKYKSQRSAVIKRQSLQIFLKYLNDLYPEREQRLPYIERLCIAVAEYYPRGILKLKDLKLLVQYHNLGLITALGLKEFNENTSIAEAGYRIAMYITEISGIADLMLKQCEAFDGSGPMALEGDDIPLECRIFSACCFFDELTVKHDFTYALRELNTLKGITFDPLIVAYIEQVAADVYNIS